MMLEVEGGTWSECMAILRHEAGHAVQHAYQLQRRRRWQQLFGPSSKHYPLLLPAQSGQPALCPASSALVRAKPSGRGFRRNLCGMVAAAVEMADTLCRLAGAEKARICRRTDGRDCRRAAAHQRLGSVSIRCPGSARRSANTTRRSRRSTSSSRRRLMTATSPGCSPPINGIDGRSRRQRSSGGTARRSGSSVARWTGENQLTLDAVLDDMISRCRELDLRAPGSERKLVINFTILLTAKTMHALFGPSRRKWIAL